MDFEIRLAAWIVDVKRAEGSKAAYQSVLALLERMSQANVEDRDWLTYLVVRVLPYAATGDEEIERAALDKLREWAAAGSSPMMRVAALSAAFGFTAIQGYHVENGKPVMSLFHDLDDADASAMLGAGDLCGVYHVSLAPRASRSDEWNRTLLALFIDAEDTVRLAATLAAIRSLNPEFAPLLQQLAISDSAFNVRLKAVNALGAIGLPNSLEALMYAAAADEYPIVRSRAVDELSKLKVSSSQVAMFLFERFKTDPVDSVRQSALISLMSVYAASRAPAVGTLLMGLFNDKGFIASEQGIALADLIADRGLTEFLKDLERVSAAADDDAYRARYDYYADRLRNPEKYASLKREIDSLSKTIEEIARARDNAKGDASEWTKVNNRYNQLVEQLEVLRAKYRSKFP